MVRSACTQALEVRCGIEMKRTAETRWHSRQRVFAAIVSLLFTVFGPVRPTPAATLSVLVVNKDGRPIPGAVVTAEPEAERAPPAPPQKTIIDQVDLTFVPDVSVVPVGSLVSFPNSDKVSHQVYSFSPARRFQLPLYRGQQYPPVVFDHPGIVTLGCNIHDDMLAYVVVTDAPYFGRTDAKGEWVMRNAAPGAYRIKLWHPLLKEPTKMIERTAQLGAESSTLSLKIDQPLRPSPLKGHPRSWDY